MLNVAHASRPLNPSSTLCPPDREDEPDFRELVRDALCVAGFVPLVGFRTAANGPLVRVTLSPGPALRERLLLAWAALGAFDSAAVSDDVIVVGWPGELSAEAA